MNTSNYFLRKLPQASEPDLAELAREVRLLREELAPPSSAIITDTQEIRKWVNYIK